LERQEASESGTERRIPVTCDRNSGEGDEGTKAITDVVAVRLAEAARRWEAERDRRSLRRAPLDLLHALDVGGGEAVDAGPRKARARTWYLRDTMSRPEKLIPASLEEAVAELKRDPSHPVHARVDGLDLELRIIASNETQPAFGARLAAIGPWEGVALDDLMKILREGREAGGSAAPPEMP
jgi:hypothetical protein